MPVHLSQHSGAVVTGKHHGREVLLSLGMSGSVSNYGTLMFDVATTSWRNGAKFPSKIKGVQVTYKQVSPQIYFSSIILLCEL